MQEGVAGAVVLVDGAGFSAVARSGGPVLLVSELIAGGQAERELPYTDNVTERAG